MDIQIILILAIVAISLISTAFVNSNYSRFLKIKNNKNLSGFDVARKILDNNGLNNILIIETRGNLSDHYDPKRKVVKLSSAVYHDTSISSVAIAAHEVGHAIQDKENNAFMKFRTLLVPIVNICSTASYIIILLGFLSEIFDFILAGIILMAAGLLFQIVTLPVEFGASKKAKQYLIQYNLIDNSERTGINKVLNSAAMTYVAGTLATALQMLRLLMLGRNRRD